MPTPPISLLYQLSRLRSPAASLFSTTKNKRMKDQHHKKSLVDQDSSVYLSDGALSTEEEIKEEAKQGNDQNEHGGLDVAALENSLNGRLQTSAGRPKRNTPSKAISQVPKVMETDVVVKIAESIEERLRVSTGRAKRKAASTMYQVPRLLRQVDENWYEPVLISIGPCYRGKTCLQPMEEQKPQHLRKILNRNKKVKLEDYIKGIMELEERARKCYSQSFSHITRGEFVEMMLLDGCFLVEIFLQNDVEKDAPAPKIYDKMWLQDFISHDMLLLENQLPYFVLRRIFELVEGDPKKVGSMAKLALDCFEFIPLMPLNKTASMKNTYRHLVDLFHHHCLPTTPKIDKFDDGADEDFEEYSGDGSDEGGEMDSSINNSGGGRGMDSSINNSRGGGEKCSSIKTKLVKLMKDSVTSFFSRKPEMYLDQQLPLHAPAARVMHAAPRKGSIMNIGKHSRVGVIDSRKKIAGPVKAVIDRATSFFRGSHLPSEELDQRQPPLSIPSAEELAEAGIVFKRKKKRGSFLSIKFHKNTGEMEVPYFYFSDGLDSVFQNFVAFELCHYPNVNTFFLGYVLFMDRIINTGKDVKILRRSEVLEHGLGSDEELASVFNRMTRGVFFDPKNTPLADTYECINDYCGRRRNVWRANLMHNYFNTPWAIISFIAAVVLLSLTAAQTFLSVFPCN